MLAAAVVHVLILTGQTDLPYHDWRLTTPVIRQALAEGFDVRVNTSPSELTDASLKGVDVVLLHYNGPRWGGGAENAVERFLTSGGGMVSLHGVSYGTFFGMEFDKRWKAPASGDRGWEAFPRILGATWKVENIGHGKRHAFPVKWVDREHPIARGLPESFTADDELYHRLDLLPDTKILAAAWDDPAIGGTGKEEPVVWTSQLGRGRTVHITLGHDVRAMSVPGFAELLRRSVRWTAGR